MPQLMPDLKPCSNLHNLLEEVQLLEEVATLLATIGLFAKPMTKKRVVSGPLSVPRTLNGLGGGCWIFGLYDQCHRNVEPKPSEAPTPTQKTANWGLDFKLSAPTPPANSTYMQELLQKNGKSHHKGIILTRNLINPKPVVQLVMNLTVSKEPATAIGNQPESSNFSRLALLSGLRV